MTTLTSPTNESYSIGYSNINTLGEHSSYQNTPQEKTSVSCNNKFVQFESYIDESRSKNQLIIKVEDSFECKITDLPGMRNKAHHTGFATEKNEHSQNSAEETYLEKIKVLEEAVTALKKDKEDLAKQIEVLKECNEDYVMKHEHFKQIIWKKDETITGQKELIESLSQKLNEVEKDNLNTRFYQEKNKQKEMKIRQLIKKLDKILQMNRGLESQVKESRQKIMGLEKQIQMNAYNQILQNRVRLKECMAVNKENIIDENRKSFENPQRKGRLSNISSLTQKTKSSSNTGRLRH